MTHYQRIAPLPPKTHLETELVLKGLAEANRALGELKGTATALPNQGILIDTLFLQEALASSEIENIVTTQDEAFQASLFPDTASVQAKEVARYREAMWLGYRTWQEKDFISENMLIDMFRLLKQRDDGYRKRPGTDLRNMKTGEIVYVPPQDGQEIIELMGDLARFINDGAACTLDPLIKMALIHHQFESIHPFPDGNGRIGRMLNMLYLTHAGLLDAPILYHSRAINRTKSDYYHLLQVARDDDAWEDWIVYMLNVITETAKSTLQLVSGIRELMAEYKHRMRKELPKIYSQDLLNNLFHHPYTRIEFVEKDLAVHYNTAASRLKTLVKFNFVTEVKSGQSNYYVNDQLVKLFVQVSSNDA